MISKLARFTLVPLFAVALTSGVALAQDPPAEGGEMPATEGTGEAMPAEATPAASESTPVDAMDNTVMKKMWLGADVGLLVPLLGNYPDAAGFGFGGHLTFDYVMSPLLSVTARAGYHHHLAKSIGGTDVTVSAIPILAGVKYSFGLVYASAEVGISMNKVKASPGGSASSNKFAAAVGAGYTMGKLDLRVGAFMPEAAKAGDGIDLMATVGFRFASF